MSDFGHPPIARAVPYPPAGSEADRRWRSNNLASARTPLAPAGTRDNLAARHAAEYARAVRELDEDI